jgi:glycosyltransferase involved in cell wall biosynthesis
MRVVLLTTQPTPYRQPLYEELGRRLPGDLHVVYRFVRSEDRLWASSVGEARSYHEHVLNECVVPTRGRSISARGGWALASLLHRLSPSTVVLGGYDAVGPALITLAKGRASRGRVILWSSAFRDCVGTTSRSSMLYRRSIFSAVDQVWAYSTRAREFALGSGARLVTVVGNPARPDVFTPRSSDRPPAPPDNPLKLLYVGRWIPRKGVDLLPIAASDLAHLSSRDVILRVVGSSSPEIIRAFESAVQGRSVRLELPGFLDSDALVDGYRWADALLVPSAVEPWGLVINEAMQCGTLVIGSPAVGAYPDLLNHGTGLVADPARADYAALLLEQFKSPKNYMARTRAARLAVERFSISACAECMVLTLDPR